MDAGTEGALSRGQTATLLATAPNMAPAAGEIRGWTREAPSLAETHLGASSTTF